MSRTAAAINDALARAIQHAREQDWPGDVASLTTLTAQLDEAVRLARVNALEEAAKVADHAKTIKAMNGRRDGMALVITQLETENTRIRTELSKASFRLTSISVLAYVEDARAIAKDAARDARAALSRPEDPSP